MATVVFGIFTLFVISTYNRKQTFSEIRTKNKPDRRDDVRLKLKLRIADPKISPIKIQIGFPFTFRVIVFK